MSIAEDGYKDTTIVYSNSSHRKIPNSKYPFKRRIGSTSVRTSKYFWIFDGHEPLEMNHHGMPWNWILKGSYLWAIEKQKYLLGPSVPQEMPLSIGGSLNRSHVLVLFLTHDLDYEGFFHIFGYGCLAGWTYDFDNWKWSNLHWCIKGFEMEVFTKLSCTSYFTKHFQLLIMMWVSKTSDPAFTSDHKVTIAKSDSGEIVQHVLIQNSGIISEFGSTQKNNQFLFQIMFHWLLFKAELLWFQSIMIQKKSLLHSSMGQLLSIYKKSRILHLAMMMMIINTDNYSF